MTNKIPFPYYSDICRMTEEAKGSITSLEKVYEINLGKRNLAKLAKAKALLTEVEEAVYSRVE